MAKGKFRGSNGNKSLVSANGGFNGREMYSAEFEINETAPSARTLLTKGYIQDEINHFSGTTVSTRGRFMTESEKQRCPNERPLYLFIQGQTKLNIDLAVQKINDIIKAEHQSWLNRPSRFTNAPPPLMSLHSGVPSVEKICIGIENAPPGFDLRGRIIGVGGANLLYIRGETGATVTVRGRGSQFIEPGLGTESPEPLHLYIEHKKPESLENAKQLGINLIQTMQSELQTFIQQQPPPVQQQQILEAAPIQQIQQAHFQTMNIGPLAQSNVLTIQHQDIIQHSQSSVVTLPATILTATMAPSTSVTVPPPGIHIPAHAAPLAPPNQTQELQTLMPPPPVGQVQLIGPPPTLSQVQYQIHPGQPLHIQMPPSVSHASAQPLTQMYVQMSQPPPPPPPPPLPPPSLPSGHQDPGAQTSFVANSNGPGGPTVSYVYAQPGGLARGPSPPPVQTVNFHQPPPPPPPPPATSTSTSLAQQPPPSLLHLHFPPPNFPPNHPPPPIPHHTYQIQYHHQQMQPPQTQFLLQSGEQIVSQQIQQNPEHPLNVPQHIVQPQGQPPSLRAPNSQTFLISAHSPHPNQHPHPHHQQLPPHGHHPLPPPGERPAFECPMEQGPPLPPPPQPVPPPQMVPPPNIAHLPNSVNILTSMPPPPPPPPPPSPSSQQHHPQQQFRPTVPNPPWSYPGQQQNCPPGPQPGQLQVQTQIHYHGQQFNHQNGQIQAQIHYAVQPPQAPRHQQSFELQKPESPEQQKCQGIKRRFADVEGPHEGAPYPCGIAPAQRQGVNGEGGGERQRPGLHGPSPGGGGAPTPGNRNKPLLPPPTHPGEKRGATDRRPGDDPGSEGNFVGEQVGQATAAPWQSQIHQHVVRLPWGRGPLPSPGPTQRDAEQPVLYPAPPPPPPPTNMPPPPAQPPSQIRPVRVFSRSMRRRS